MVISNTLCLFDIQSDDGVACRVYVLYVHVSSATVNVLVNYCVQRFGSDVAKETTYVLQATPDHPAYLMTFLEKFRTYPPLRIECVMLSWNHRTNVRQFLGGLVDRR